MCHILTAMEEMPLGCDTVEEAREHETSLGFGARNYL